MTVCSRRTLGQRESEALALVEQRREVSTVAELGDARVAAGCERVEGAGRYAEITLHDLA
jgi:hypothetical protein